MATFYRGHRPILQGRNANDAKHMWTGTAGTYSNYDVMNTSQMFDGAPDRDVVPGAGPFPHGLQLTRRFLGLDTKSPMDGSGGGPELDYLRGLGNLNFPVPGAEALLNAGHLPRETPYSTHTNLEPHAGVPSADRTLIGGHLPRLQEAAPTGGGRTAPWEYQGVTVTPLDDSGDVRPAAGTAGVYGHEHTAEWAGVPSARAL